MNCAICVGNGLHTDGSTSKINQKIVDLAARMWVDDTTLGRIILCGGYKNKSGVTEAKSMEDYLLSRYSDLKPLYTKENKSYRTHNNAIEALRIVSKYSFLDEVTIIDHPQHLQRTLLSFKTVNRLYYSNKYQIVGLPIEEIYDSDIPGQEYWATKEQFVEHEKNPTILYRFLLSHSWARLGLWILRTVWPSEKQ